MKIHCSSKKKVSFQFSSEKKCLSVILFGRFFLLWELFQFPLRWIDPPTDIDCNELYGPYSKGFFIVDRFGIARWCKRPFPNTEFKYYNSSNDEDADKKMECVFATKAGPKDDALAMYMNNDVKLRMNTDIVPAHKFVLSAPVFRALFSKDMKEGTDEFVDIKDVDAATVRRMLLFLYSDCVEDLSWESASHLYSAACKYRIAPLRHRCSSILKENLQQLRCVELKAAVLNCIAANKKEVVESEKWRKTEKGDPQLALDVFQV
ncbi:speckle-type POZ protein [Trichonephila inaurata madagascariensis]|uniref:Speckle-type POZ protein n=1 Tax=Trichonephila inaurata madagascariensis TaxID=2747483 RepID=A0A8X6IUV0_9ARAC|nr:speckle-type POZ protein [Trichonephila inaurata madagascariensis]